MEYMSSSLTNGLMKRFYIFNGSVWLCLALLGIRARELDDKKVVGEINPVFSIFLAILFRLLFSSISSGGVFDDKLIPMLYSSTPEVFSKEIG